MKFPNQKLDVNDPTVIAAIRMPSKMRVKLDERAKALDLTFSEFMRRAAQAKLEETEVAYGS
jgi:predicted DNA-binding protein